MDRRSGRLPKNIRLASLMMGSSRLFYIHKPLINCPRIPGLATGKGVNPKQPTLCKSGKTIAKSQRAQHESRPNASYQMSLWPDKVTNMTYALSKKSLLHVRISSHYH